MPRWPLGGGQFTKGPARWCACLEAGDHPEEPGHLCGPGETFAAPGSEPSEEGDGGQDVQLIPKIFPMGQKLLPLAGVRGEARRSEVGRPAGIRLRPLDAGLPPRKLPDRPPGALSASPPACVLRDLLPWSLHGGRAHGAGPFSSSAPLPGPPGRSEAVGATIRAPSNEVFLAPLDGVCSTWI